MISNKKYTVLIIVFVFSALCFCLPPSIEKEIELRKKGPLVNAGEVVFTAHCSEDAKKSGLTEKIISNEVELILRRNHIPSTSPEEYNKRLKEALENNSTDIIETVFAKNTISLIVEVRSYYRRSVQRDILGFFSVVWIKVRDGACLTRHLNNKDLKSPPSYIVTTWEEAMVCSGHHTDLKKQTTEAIQDLTKQFVIDYLKANAEK